jgi:zinc carboxypeptidase/carboxypeptidase family protein
LPKRSARFPLFQGCLATVIFAFLVDALTFVVPPSGGSSPLVLPARAEALPAEEAEPHKRRPATIQRTGDGQVQVLIEANMDIDSLRAETVGVHATEREFEWVKSQGWEIEWVPDADLPYWTERKVDPGPLQTPVAFYPTYEQLTNDLQILAASYPNLCRLESIGKSVLERDLWFLKITDNPDLQESEPEFKYISTMHGTETVGLIMTLNLVHLLLEDYATDGRIRDLIDDTEIWIMPLMNPDGYSSRQYENENNENLNRDFPDPVNPGYEGLRPGREPETLAVMEFGSAHSSVLSANFHTGELVVNYAFDHTYSLTPDDDVFVNVSRAYADLNPPMYANLASIYNDVEFDQGIVRGAIWYVISGGMQDWNYVRLGCNEVTIELYDIVKSPDESLLGSLWDDNRESMLAYMERVHIGVRGLVTDSRTGQPLPATVRVAGRDHDVFTDPDVGDYHRMLLPGTYDLTFSAEGYQPRTIGNVAVEEGPATVLDVSLESDYQPSSIWRVR